MSTEPKTVLYLASYLNDVIMLKFVRSCIVGHLGISQ